MAPQQSSGPSQNMRAQNTAAKHGLIIRIRKASVRLSKALFVPNRLSRIPIYEMLNASDATRTRDLSLSVAGSPASAEISDADRSTERWRNSKIQELQFIGLTAALVASLIGSAFTWPNLASGPWSTKASWQASLMLIIASITIATQQSISLYRYSGSKEGLKAIRTILRGSTRSTVNEAGTEEVIPSWYCLYVWQLPAMMLRAGIICFIIGTTALLWDAAHSAGHGWRSDDVKILIVFMVAAVFAIANHFFSVMCIYPREE